MQPSLKLSSFPLALAISALLPLTALAAPTPPAAGSEPVAEGASAAHEPVKIYAEQKGWTRRDAPRKTTTGPLRVRATTSNTYLKFLLPESAGELTSAKLVLTARQATNGQRLTVDRTSPRWNSSTLSHLRSPKPIARLAKFSPVAEGRRVELPLSLSDSTASSRWLSVKISATVNSPALAFTRHGIGSPRLLLTFSSPAVDPPLPEDEEPAVYAHYFPPYPLSLDNKLSSEDYYARNYLTIDGEGGKHRAYGGLLRDRPLPAAPAANDWKLANLVTEVRQAKAAGIDGFTLNMMSTSGLNWEASLRLMKAAALVGDFTIIPNIDVSASIGSQEPAFVASKLAELYAFPSAGKSDEGLLLSSFLAERQTASWWDEVIEATEARVGPVSFTAIFLNASEANMKAFAPISDGFGNWGVRTADSLTRAPNYASRAHAMGKTWMQPVAFQDARPRSNVYAEASNTEAGRVSWMRAIQDDADSVQLVTWNDYSESTHIAPSVAHGATFLSIGRYYIDWFKTGRAPKILKDRLFLTHRSHLWAAKATSGIQTMMPTLGGSSTPPRDTVEALVFLTEPSEVTITVAGISQRFSQPAGVSAVLVPLKPGLVSATVKRQEREIAAVNSPFRVTATPLVQDFQYFAVEN